MGGIYAGPTELAAVGVAIAVFNQVSKITIFPLVSITTSFVAEEDTIEQLHIEGQKNKNGDKWFPVDKESDVEMEELLPQSGTLYLDRLSPEPTQFLESTLITKAPPAWSF